MFKYVKDFFKTLSMEIGGVKSQSVDLTISAFAQSLKVKVELPKVFSVDDEIKVLGETFSRNVKIKSESFKDQNVEIFSENFSTRLLVINNPLESFKTSISSTKIENKVNLVSEDLTLENPKIENGISDFKITIRNGKDLPHIWRISYIRSPLVEKEKILDALTRLLRRYGGKPEKMEFLGYFRDIPIGMAEAIVVEKGKLVLSISRKKKRRSAVVDLVAIKTPKGVMMEVVR